MPYIVNMELPFNVEEESLLTSKRRKTVKLLCGASTYFTLPCLVMNNTFLLSASLITDNRALVSSSRARDRDV